MSTNPAMQVELGPEAVAFMHRQRFFFLASSSDTGSSDCSYRGRAQRTDGSFDPLVEVLDGSTLVLPDYKGNNLFNTLGNLIVNPAIALLFVDFEQDATPQIQGRATIEEDAGRWSEIWPLAQRYVVVAVTQVQRRAGVQLPALVPAAARADAQRVV